MIVTLEERHLSAVVALHLRAFPEDFITSLGESFLRQKFYPHFLRSDLGVGFVCELEAGLAGYIAGTTDAAKLYRTMLWSSAPSLLVAVVVNALRRPSYAGEALRTIRFMRGGPRPPVPAELSYIAVDTLVQREHLQLGGEPIRIGEALVEALLHHLREIGAPGCWTKTTQQNAAANALYQKMGFHFIETIRTARGVSNLLAIQWGTHG